MMLPQETIRAKRDGATLDPQEIEAFIHGLTTESVTEGQAAAFAMAVFFRGMTFEEAGYLTTCMATSGRTLTWDLPGPVLDKHSTGGVGDTVSLALAPMISACGGFVPMISGRGLGHTGGTLDKLEAIPGYNATPSINHFQQVVREVGCAIIGQTTDLAPADRRLYAIRDVTATVESITLITASILSKKIAAGLDGLVMDVKTGSGAFMPTHDASRNLATSIIQTARAANLPCIALITDMDQPLASSAGNALETMEAIRYLTGDKREPRFHEVTLALGIEMLLLGKIAASADEAKTKLMRALESGEAAERLARMVKALNGPSDLMQAPARHLPQAPIQKPVFPTSPGYVSRIDTRELGLAVVALGGGRTRASDPIDPSVGMTHLAGINEECGSHRPLAIIHAATQAQADDAARRIAQAYTLHEKRMSAPVTIQEKISA